MSSVIKGRGLRTELLYRLGGLKQREIGAMLGVDYSAVSIFRKPFDHLMKGDRNGRLPAEKRVEMLCRD
jgi:hypothetical protein